MNRRLAPVGSTVPVKRLSCLLSAFRPINLSSTLPTTRFQREEANSRSWSGAGRYRLIKFAPRNTSFPTVRIAHCSPILTTMTPSFFLEILCLADCVVNVKTYRYSCSMARSRPEEATGLELNLARLYSIQNRYKRANSPGPSRDGRGRRKVRAALDIRCGA